MAIIGGADAYGEEGGAGGKQRKLRRIASLKRERSGWDSYCREIAELQFPQASRFTASEVNQGGKKHQHINDETAIFSRRTLAAGMMSGVTSPARPWFRLGLHDKGLMEHGPVKQWLHVCTELMRAVFASSNTYNALHSCYEELAVFGTWADLVLPDFDNVVHHYPMTFGEYMIATDHRGVVNTLAREFSMTVGQMAKQFGKENLSPTARNLYAKGNYDAWVEVYHLIEPREMYDTRKKDGKNMPFASCYFEPAREDWDKYLSEGGFKRFPGLCPRWTVTGGDIYGRSPGMDAQGSVAQLQHETLRKSQAIEYQVFPPLQAPTTYKDNAQARLPGGISYVDSVGAGTGIRSAWEVNIQLQPLLMSIADVRDRIRTAYYTDLFLMLASQPANGSMTATEVAERHEEKLLMLGPVLERLHTELLSPLIDITFDRLTAAGVLPEPPPEIAGMDLDIQFISVLAQAQRAVAVSGMERMLATTMQISAAVPTILDKVDFDQVVDDLADAFGVNPALVRPDADVAQLRQAQAQQQQAMQAAAAAPAAVDAAKTASEVDTDNLANVMQMLQGYNTPAAVQ